MTILEQIKNGTGKQIYNFMKEIEKRRSNGENRQEFREWWNACVERAKEINSTKFGDWEDAKSKLDNLIEPKISFGDKKNKITYIQPLNGFPCVYAKYESGGRAYITNPKTNSMYVRDFSEVKELQPVDIFK